MFDPRILFVNTLLISVFSSTAIAGEKPSSWKSQAELGMVVTSGNTETSTINAKVDATHEEGQWRHNLHAEALNTTSNDVTSAEKYLTTGQSDFKYSKTGYVFGIVSYENDRFSGFEYQASTTVGYGRRVLDRADMKLDLEVGPGFRFYKDEATMVSDHDPFLHFAAKYSWAVSANATFTENLSSEIGGDLTVTKSVTSLKANINSTLALKISFTAKNTSDVPVGNKKSDTETAVTLVYSF